jgi:hypothetical protein
MPDLNHRRVAAVAIISVFALASLSVEATAKTHSRSHAAAVATASGYMSGVAGYVSGGSIRAPSSVYDNTAGWGCSGAF